MEKQGDKAAKRMQRKAEKLSGGGIPDDGTQELDEEAGLGEEAGEAGEAGQAGEAAGLPDPRGSGS